MCISSQFRENLTTKVIGYVLESSRHEEINMLSYDFLVRRIGNILEA